MGDLVKTTNLFKYTPLIYISMLTEFHYYKVRNETS